MACRCGLLDFEDWPGFPSSSLIPSGPSLRVRVCVCVCVIFDWQTETSGTSQSNKTLTEDRDCHPPNVTIVFAAGCCTDTHTHTHTVWCTKSIPPCSSECRRRRHRRHVGKEETLGVVDVVCPSCTATPPLCRLGLFPPGDSIIWKRRWFGGRLMIIALSAPRVASSSYT